MFSSFFGTGAPTGRVFVVVGASRGTGLEVVKRLIELPTAEVNEIRAVIRESSSFSEEVQDERLKLFRGDCTEKTSLKPAFAGANIVVFCASSSSFGESSFVAVDEIGVKNTAEIALEEKVERVVLVSSQLVHPDNFWSPIRMMINLFTTGPISFTSTMTIKYRGEQHLRRSGQPYTIVRPGRLVDGPLHSSTPVVGQTNSFVSGSAGGTTRADLAAVCVAAALSPLCKNVTFELNSDFIAEGSSVPERLDAEKLFKDLSVDWDKRFLSETL
jgi:nucleoside-diphosphate-sugar epimerase